MQINSSPSYYQSSSYVKAPINESVELGQYKQGHDAFRQAMSLQSGGELTATPYQGSAFDNAIESVQFFQRTPSGGFGESFRSGVDKVPIIDAEKVNHLLMNGQETTKNINLYQQSMEAQGKEAFTKATILIDGVFVALQTIDGEIASPFRGELDYLEHSWEEIEKIEEVRELIQQSDGNFDTLVGKLEAKFGDQVSVEVFEDGQEEDYAYAHALLNNSSWDDYVSGQTGKMEETQSMRSESLHKMEEGLKDYNLSSQKTVFTIDGIIVANEHNDGIHIDQNNLIQEAEARGIDRKELDIFFTYTAMKQTDAQTMKGMLESVFAQGVEMKKFENEQKPTGLDITQRSAAQYIRRYTEIANIST